MLEVGGSSIKLVDGDDISRFRWISLVKLTDCCEEEEGCNKCWVNIPPPNFKNGFKDDDWLPGRSEDAATWFNADK